MINITFKYLSEIVVVQINGKTLLFANSITGLNYFVPIDMINFTREGILKEHPDLSELTYPEQKREATKRLKDKLQNMNSEEEIKDYVINELSKLGYILVQVKKQGFRSVSYA